MGDDCDRAVRVNMKRLLLFTALAARLMADPAAIITQLVGPVIPYGDSPWSAYDITIKAMLDTMIPAALTWVPLAGAALPGTYTYSATPSPRFLGTTAPGVIAGDQILIGWNPSGETVGSGRFYITVSSVSGNDILISGLPEAIKNSSPLSGLTIYECDRCVVDVISPDYPGSEILVYSCPFWGVCGQGSNDGWSYYDMNVANYRMYLRTGDSDYLDAFNEWAEDDWLWNFKSGATEGMNPPRWYPMLSAFIRANIMGGAGAGGEARLAAIKYMIGLNYTFNIGARLSGQDNREPGVTLNWMAMGAIADSDATRHAYYCTSLKALAQEAIDVQRSGGYWIEKNNAFPYATPSEAPWRILYMNQGLARGYESVSDPANTDCYDATLAAGMLAAVEASAEFIYTLGYDQDDRSTYYNVLSPTIGLPPTIKAGDCTTPIVGGTTFSCVSTSGTVNTVGTAVTWVSGDTFGTGLAGEIFTINSVDYVVAAVNSSTSLTLTGSAGTQSGVTYAGGTNLIRDYACDGTDFIGFEDTFGTTWTGRLNSCGSISTGTLDVPWAGVEQTTYAYNGIRQPSQYTSISIRRSAESGTCYNPAAEWCVIFGNRLGNWDSIWIMGWLYNQTGAAKWKTYGDELFSASYGGPADGVGGTDPCAGPDCDDYEAGYGSGLIGCGSNGNIPPCNPTNNQPGNLNAFPSTLYAPRSMGQIDGIGGASNYLAWRLGEFAPNITQVCPLPAAPEDEAYSRSLTTVGSEPLTWSISAGALPTGLSLSSSGLLSGTPTTPGSYSFTLSVTNSEGSDTEPCSLEIQSAGPALGTPVSLTGAVKLTGGATIH